MRAPSHTQPEDSNLHRQKRRGPVHSAVVALRRPVSGMPLEQDGGREQVGKKNSVKIITVRYLVLCKTHLVCGRGTTYAVFFSITAYLICRRRLSIFFLLCLMTRPASVFLCLGGEC